MALALVKGRAAEAAQQLIDQVPDLLKTPAAQHREIALAAAELAMQRKEYDVATLGFDFLTRNNGDGFDARMGLGRVAAAKNDLVEAEKQFNLAKKFDPERNDPYTELGKLLLKTREEDALRELEKAALLDCMDASIPPVLVEKHALKKRWAKVVEVAPLALYVAPFDAKVHLHYASALLETGKKAEAREELAAAKACELDEEQQKVLEALTARAK
jgi:Flp pilus assembly protein TadD